MELDLIRNNSVNIADSMKNAVATVNETFNNVFNKGLDNIGIEEGMLTKVKDGLKKFNLKNVVSDTIDTALKSTLKSVAGVKAKTVENFKDLGKAIRDSNLKGGIKSIVNIGVDSIKGVPTSIKNVVKDGIDLVLGDTFDDELQRVMTKQKNTLSKINKKCDSFEKALSEGNDKDMKKCVNSISKDLEKISLISKTIDRGREIINRYELMKNKGSTELSSIEQELCAKLI